MSYKWNPSKKDKQNFINKMNDIDIILNQVSNTQAYKLAGNSIVVNVLVEIFKQLF